MLRDSNLVYKRAFGALGSETRYFLAGYVLGEWPLSRNEMNVAIRLRYPSIYSSFFERPGYYAFGICEKSLSSLGLAENAGKIVHHPTRGDEEVAAYKATDLVEKLRKIVNFWWKTQLEYNVHASKYIAPLSGPTLDTPFNRAKVIHRLSEHDSVALEDLAVDFGLSYDKLFRHVEALESLAAVKIETSKRQKWGQYKSSRVYVMDGLRLIDRLFVGPAFENMLSIEATAQKSAPKSFTKKELFELLKMHYGAVQIG